MDGQYRTKLSCLERSGDGDAALRECAALYIVVGRRVEHYDIHVIKHASTTVEIDALLITIDLAPARMKPEMLECCCFRWGTKTDNAATDLVRGNLSAIGSCGS